ncbi:hypothetical protein BESB_084100 [Besnoitia besnoiti]|uniref:Protein kinase domain-containing protein n=1 Tax=Besnoitia besnoiti TaxID=94643 RepID=A0A2A9MA66_BESBE|nr:hypothetical protein BESB_084100 [Besnoitia besnoiti]PFH33211.1 hypothetical protein BESB_084100 [Besnoitia besnoiti]
MAFTRGSQTRACLVGLAWLWIAASLDLPHHEVGLGGDAAATTVVWQGALRSAPGNDFRNAASLKSRGPSFLGVWDENAEPREVSWLETGAVGEGPSPRPERSTDILDSIRKQLGLNRQDSRAVPEAQSKSLSPYEPTLRQDWHLVQQRRSLGRSAPERESASRKPLPASEIPLSAGEVQHLGNIAGAVFSRPTRSTEADVHLHILGTAAPGAPPASFVAIPSHRGRSRSQSPPRRSPSPGPASQQTDPVCFKPQEPGDAIIRYALTSLATELGRHMVEISPNAPANKIVDEIWKENETLTLSSERSGKERQLLRGPVLGAGKYGIVFSARDVTTQEKVVIKLFWYRSNPSSVDLEEIREEAESYNMFDKIKDPQAVQLYLRFLVPSDMLVLPGKGEFLANDSDSSQTPIANLFMVMPQAHSELTSIIEALEEAHVTNTDLALDIRLQLTLASIRLAANLQNQGVVHHDIYTRNVLVMHDGRVLLADFGMATKAAERRTRAAAALSLEQWLSRQYAQDACDTGRMLYRVWCKRSLSYADESSPLSFEGCFRLPQPVEKLIARLLEPSVDERLLAMDAIRTPEFQEIEQTVLQRSRLYAARRQRTFSA